MSGGQPPFFWICGVSMEHNYELNERLRDIRDRANVSNQVIAELLDISYDTAKSYMSLRLPITKIVVAERAEVAIKLLEDMLEAGYLPIETTHTKTDDVVSQINEFLEK